MNYAITYHQSNAIGKTKGVAQATRRVCGVAQKAERCSRSEKGQAKSSPGSHATNGIIGLRFGPKLYEPKIVEDCKQPDQLERDFFKSLSKLAKHYNLQFKSFQEYTFPFNIALMLDHLRFKIKEIPNCQSVELMQDCGKAYLETEERYDTKATLYYIPVMPMYKLMKDKERKAVAQMILSVFAYLYHIIGIPYYRNTDSFLFWQYDMLKEWIICDGEEGEDLRQYMQEFDKAIWVGDFVKRKMINRESLNRFKDHINKFQPKDEFDKSSLEVAKEAFSLYTTFPGRDLFQNIPQIEESEEILRMDQYISFFADAEGMLADQLYDCITCEFQEYGLVEEPTIRKKFDGKKLPDNTLEFETRIFKMIDNLTFLLNHY